MSSPVIDWLGDRALLVSFGDAIDPALNARVHAAAARVRDAGLRGVADLVPAYASLCVHLDPRAIDVADAGAVATLLAALQGLLDDSRVAPLPEAGPQAPVVEVPVCYGGAFGPDLDDLATQAGLRIDEAIALHAAPVYRVAMLGFAAGFPYLLGLDARLQAPRRAQPRTRVAAGSVAIGGAQTGIYPRTLPGGWQVIGRTPLALFDAQRTPPALLVPGQRVRFRPIAAADADWPA